MDDGSGFQVQDEDLVHAFGGKEKAIAFEIDAEVIEAAGDVSRELEAVDEDKRGGRLGSRERAWNKGKETGREGKKGKSLEQVLEVHHTSSPVKGME
ncbi:MAG TPA: hypothetical protein VKB26_05775 [Candidatus Acidoferrales bacterium]|nr:hypothetical protein [Candidatus Acidoferrales bacterium]